MGVGLTISMVMLMAKLFSASFGGDIGAYHEQFMNSPELAEAAGHAQKMAGYDSWRLMNEPRKMAVIVAIYTNPETRWNVALSNALRDRDWRRAGAIYEGLFLGIPEARQLNLAWSLETGEWL